MIYESDRKRPWRFRRNYVADRKQGYLAEAVVCVEGDSAEVAPAPARPQQWTIDQKNYRFIPQTLAIRAGDRIRFTNSDPLLHDVTARQTEGSSSEILLQDTFSLQQREEVQRTYRHAGGTQSPIALTCRFHGAMQGWIYVFDHRVFQVTGKDGRFRLVGVSAGRRRLIMVHPGGQLRWEQLVEVSEGGSQRLEIRVTPDNLVTAKQ